MIKIGILSDTHNIYDTKLEEFLAPCSLLFHAGDIGSLQLADTIAAQKELIAVSGNIDDHKVRRVYPQITEIEVEKVKILMTHIGGYPGNYYRDFYNKIRESKPQIVICGHSHILKVVYDKSLEHLHINPGGAGIHGFHKVRTAIRLSIDGDRIFDLEVGEWSKK